MNTLQKIRIAQDVLSRGKKIKDTANVHGISPSTVRRYMDLYTEQKLKLNVKKELQELRLFTYLATKDTDAKVHARRLEYIDEALMAINSQVA